LESIHAEQDGSPRFQVPSSLFPVRVPGSSSAFQVPRSVPGSHRNYGSLSGGIPRARAIFRREVCTAR
jgi:hypothetical protein